MGQVAIVEVVVVSVRLHLEKLLVGVIVYQDLNYKSINIVNSGSVRAGIMD